MKTCSKCKIAKSLTEFGKDKKMKDGVRYCCKQCNNAASVAWALAYPDRKKAARVKYVTTHPEANAASKAVYRKNNKEKIAVNNAQYRKENPEKNTSYGASYRAKKALATPAWLSQEQSLQIADFYKMAKELESVFPWKQHVDHVVPIKNTKVCGMHVPWNLQILSVTANLAKGNKYSGC
jgi:5-methylcytosine-specific restriction endonuclease McrA